MKRIALTLALMSTTAVFVIGCSKSLDDSTIRASGHIEATEVRLAAKVGGRLL